MSSIYEAVPLDRDISSTNIRVIEDLVRDAEGRISCKLRTIELERKFTRPRKPGLGPEKLEWVDRKDEEPESYRALSYVWGPPDVGKSILIDGKPFEVRQNLWNFLNEACARETLQDANNAHVPRFLWIDAICIDQSQVKERNHQVAMMGKIYSRAYEVLVWLGQSTPLIAELLYNMHGLEVDEYHKLVWATEIEPDEKKRMQSGLEDLCRVEYWERLWVVQEYLLAKRVKIWCGAESVNPEKIKWLVYLEFKTASLAESCALELLQGKKVRNAHAEQLSLKRHLDDFGIRMKCTDVRDRVYGLLALINEKELETLNIRPNYALTTHDLFFRLYIALHKSGSCTPNELSDYVETLRLALELSSHDVVENIRLFLGDHLYNEWVARENQSA
ncbi:hypothetical protein AA0119_g11215 [Alternaria tenuissima]|jgi:hypothetical protein|uniref:Heterokaryon incompatibility domain-containing protein n=1 Tax=Alternaria tenuissima TaxID=119927 RepID=A0A4Q4RAH7_9PLEO|nr:hypothetical protein AA0114_g10309 [Alternaria tenuissima]RYN90097.1 hypothetical protein AA0119_g11215 [Alternaria tenuissima]RYO06491.1 hypothetical protein AA0121_g12036 [Alternaria tenuissima]RYO53507.1 hypothetical protein AA0116_g10189 [Alternaria tenuissima]